MDEMRGFSEESIFGYEARKGHARWPAGDIWRSHDDLPGHLASSGRWHARNALRHWTDDDLDEALTAAVSAGCAVELLAKACLAKVSPALLLERADVESVLHLSGRGNLSQASPTIVKTVGATGALTSLKKLLPTLPYSARNDEVLFRVRNAAIHMALLDKDELAQAIKSMVRLCDRMVALSHWTPEGFWGRTLVAAAIAVADEEASEVKARVAAKTAAATMRWEELQRDIPVAIRSTYLRALRTGGPNTTIEHEQRQDCPICGESGWVSCAIQEDVRELDMPEGSLTEVVARTAWPQIFECHVCGLRIEDRELSEFEDLPQWIDLPLHDDDDYEPGEDWLSVR